MNKKKNPQKNSYYWRAVRRIAKRFGISINKARKRDWQKEARAEFKRRSKSHVSSIHPAKKPVHRKVLRPSPPVKPGKRKVEPYFTKHPVPSPGPIRELKIRDYDRIPERDEDEFEEEEDWEAEWESGFNIDFSELDDMDDLDDFLSDFEHVDEEEYQEPA